MASSGGTTRTGGAVVTGGTVGSGGVAGSGGQLASGGAPRTGGQASTGGIRATGGAVNATGGAQVPGDAAVPDTGGADRQDASAPGTGGVGGKGSGGAGGAWDAGGTGGERADAGGAPDVANASITILPGAVWKDSQGNVIQAHGEGITVVEGVYYWIGEDKTNGSPFQNIKCYRSTDLLNWTFVNNLLTRQASGDLGPNRIIERPHVIYNASTSKFVMYMHVDNASYTDRRAGVASGSTVCGTYTYHGSFRPLNHESLDDTLFQDGTTGYFLSEDRANAKLQIYKLSDDYLTVASLVATLPQIESPAVVKIGGTYYIFGSHLTGWATNDNQYTSATSLAGPWSGLKSFAPAGTNTCNSQVTFILPVVGSSTTSYIFLGDRWNSNNLTDSRYIWQPLTFNGTAFSMTCPSSWKINLATGVWSL